MAENMRRVNEPIKLPARESGGHKGSFGRVLVVGGAPGMTGALSLTANGALRGGAGLVTFAAPQCSRFTVAALAPCALSVGLDCDEQGDPAPLAVRQMLEAAKYDVLALGPGLGRGRIQQEMVRAALGQSKPLVIDADGLNNLSEINNWPTLARCPVILTPHPGELSRLTGKDIADIQASREPAAIDAVESWRRQADSGRPIVLVLKGAGTVVADADAVYVNDTGNPGMATGGTGDVLTGLTAALWGQGLEPFEAACLAAWAHGLAGDLAAEQIGQVSLIASDLLDFLPQALQQASMG